MYYTPYRRKGKSIGAAGARARLDGVDSQQGDRHEFLRRHEMEAAYVVRASVETRRLFLDKLLTRTADFRNLRLAWEHLEAEGGQAPGVDNLRYSDLDRHEVWELLHTISRTLTDETYRTDNDRRIRIPKTSGKGHRTLSLPVIIDRLVQRAITQIVQPFLNGYLRNTCLGYRPHSSTLRALAMAEKLAREGGRWIWLPDDIQNAFDCVPQRRLINIIRHYIPSEPTMRLIERVVITGEGMGIRQGGSLSPPLLNLYLHHTLDQPWSRRNPGIPLLRWADDILILCESQEEAKQAHRRLQDLLLPAGMRLKGSEDSALADLSDGAKAEWLGYGLTRRNDAMIVQITERAWKHLYENLALAHKKAEAPLRARDTILGWISQMGPCYDQIDINQAYARIATLSQELAYDEIPSQVEVDQHWKYAHTRWTQIREPT